MHGVILLLPYTPPWHVAQLKKAQGQLLIVRREKTEIAELQINTQETCVHSKDLMQLKLNITDQCIKLTDLVHYLTVLTPHG
jgi:hypothetical protein